MAGGNESVESTNRSVTRSNSSSGRNNSGSASGSFNNSGSTTTTIQVRSIPVMFRLGSQGRRVAHGGSTSGGNHGNNQSSDRRFYNHYNSMLQAAHNNRINSRNRVNPPINDPSHRTRSSGSLQIQRQQTSSIAGSSNSHIRFQDADDSMEDLDSGLMPEQTILGPISAPDHSNSTSSNWNISNDYNYVSQLYRGTTLGTRRQSNSETTNGISNQVIRIDDILSYAPMGLVNPSATTQAIPSVSYTNRNGSSNGINRRASLSTLRPSELSLVVNASQATPSPVITVSGQEYQKKLSQTLRMIMEKIDEINSSMIPGSSTCNANANGRLSSFQRFCESKFRNDMEYFASVFLEKSMQFALNTRNPAKVSESYHLTETLDIFVRTLAILVLNVPSSRGIVFGNHIKITVVELFKGVYTLFHSCLEQPINPKNPQEYLFSSFNVIPFVCNMLLRLPVNNIQALTRKWEEWLEILQETLNELERLVDDSGMFDFDEKVFELERDNLTEEDRAMMKRCAALIKVTRILIRKILVRCIKVSDANNIDHMEWLDQLHDRCKEVISLIDDLIMTIFSRQENREKFQSSSVATFFSSASNNGSFGTKEDDSIICGDRRELGFSGINSDGSLGNPLAFFNSTTTSVFASRLVTGCLSLIDLALVHAPSDHTNWFERCSEQYIRILVSIHERNPQR